MLNRENAVQLLKDDKSEQYNEITIHEIPFVNKLNLRLDLNNKKIISKCKKVLENLLHFQSNTYTQNKNLKIIWLGPNEWLIVSREKNDLLQKLKREIGDAEASITDTSDNRTIIQVSGKKLITLLSKFLVVNLDKNLGSKYSCVQTLFVKVPILLTRNNDNNQIPSVDIYTNRSHANYIYKLLVDGTKNLNF